MLEFLKKSQRAQLVTLDIVFAKAIVRHFQKLIEINGMCKLHPVVALGQAVVGGWTAQASQQCLPLGFDESQVCDATCLGIVGFKAEPAIEVLFPL